MIPKLLNSTKLACQSASLNSTPRQLLAIPYKHEGQSPMLISAWGSSILLTSRSCLFFGDFGFWHLTVRFVVKIYNDTSNSKAIQLVSFTNRLCALVEATSGRLESLHNQAYFARLKLGSQDMFSRLGKLLKIVATIELKTSIEAKMLSHGHASVLEGNKQQTERVTETNQSQAYEGGPWIFKIDRPLLRRI